MTIRLSRLDITGPLRFMTPRCVLQEISNALGLIPSMTQNLLETLSGIEHLQKTLERAPVSTFPSLAEANLSKIARYINPTQTVQWPNSETLLDAFRFLQQFNVPDEKLPEIPRSFHIGLQTPQQPHAWNACVLYRYCCKFQLPLTFETTLDQMATAMKCQVWSDTELRRVFSQVISRQAVHPTLISFIMQIPNFFEQIPPRGSVAPTITERKRQTLDPEQLRLCQAELLNLPNLQRRISPQNTVEAIVLAAMLHRVNIRTAANPMEVFMWSSFRDYSRLGAQFDSHLPESLYTREELHGLALAEGFTEDELKAGNVFELLQVAELTNTFYHGQQPEAKNTETPFSADEIKTLPPDLIVCYGARNAQMQALTYPELVSQFQAQNFFTNPFETDGSKFSRQTVRKLKLLCEGKYEAESKLGGEARGNLLRIIQGIEVRSATASDKIRELYSTACRDEKQLLSLHETLEQLLVVAMTMRGWFGPEHPYPLADAPVHNQHEVDVKVTGAIAQFDKLCAEGPFGQNILQLPLVLFQDGEYKVSRDEGKGRTIAERLAIVKAGTTTEACIRLSSNWLLSSAYRYLQAIGFQPNFRLEEMRLIS
jgi:hypothetical protein